MSVSFYFTKQPREETTLAINFSGTRELQAGETIFSAAVEITQAGLPVDGILVSYAIAGARVLVRVRGGESNKDYKITVLATTNAGHVREAEAVMAVREK